jgi:hypothetical protein
MVDCPAQPVKRNETDATLFATTILFSHFVGDAQWSLAGFCLSADHSVRFPNSTTLIAGSFQAFISNFRPELF